MKNLSAFKALSISLTLALVPCAAPILAQQQAGQVVCFSFEGTDKLSGKDNTGGKSSTGVQVGGKTFLVGSAGSTPADCATALLADLKKAGYTASKSGKQVVCVSAGPKGAPLTRGGGIGSTDTGLDGIDCSVHRPPVVPNKLPPKKKTKLQGVTLPKPKPSARVKVTQTLTIEIEIVKVVLGFKVTFKIKVQVKLTIGMGASQIEKAIADALRRAGFHIQDACYQSFLHKAPIPCWAIDYTHLGEPVQHVILWQPVQTELIPMDLSAGVPLLDMGGSTSYGSTTGQASKGMFHGFDSMARPGGLFTPFVANIVPGSRVIFAISPVQCRLNSSSWVATSWSIPSSR